METKKKRRIGFPLYTLAAFAWFGNHCGSGTASGLNCWLYSGHFGNRGWISIVAAWVFATVFVAIYTEYARVVKAKSYKDVVSGVYLSKNPIVVRFVLFLWDFIVLISMIAATSACVAGCGTLFNELFNMPYAIGCGIFVILVLGIMVKGESVERFFGNVSGPLIVLYILIAGVGIALAWPHVIEVMTTSQGEPVYGDASIWTLIITGFTYGNIQTGVAPAMSIYGGEFKSRTEAMKASIYGGLINMVTMLMAYFALMAFYPSIGDEAIPFLSIIRNNIPGVGGAILVVAYNITLFLAFLTTAGALCLGGMARYAPLLNTKIPNLGVCKGIVVAVALLGSSALSTLGLNQVLSTVNSIISYIKMPCWFFPIVILGPIAIHMELKKQKAAAAAGSGEAEAE